MVGDKMVRTKGCWTKWYGQNSTDKMVRIKYYRVINQSRFRWPYDFFINPASTFTPLAFFYVLIILFVTLGNNIYIEFNYIKMYIRYEIVPICPYHFVRTILSSTILSLYHFVHTILSVPFCPLPFFPVTAQWQYTGEALGLNSKHQRGNRQKPICRFDFAVNKPAVRNLWSADH